MFACIFVSPLQRKCHLTPTSARSRLVPNGTLPPFRPALTLKGAAGCSLLQPRQLPTGSKFPTSVLCCPDRSSSDMTSIVCRVQYLDDSDPFICTNFPEPRRPPTVSLEEDVPLSEQVAGIHKLLEAPLKVGRVGPDPGIPGSWTRSEVRTGQVREGQVWKCHV